MVSAYNLFTNEKKSRDCFTYLFVVILISYVLLLCTLVPPLLALGISLTILKYMRGLVHTDCSFLYSRLYHILIFLNYIKIFLSLVEVQYNLRVQNYLYLQERHGS